MRTDDFNGPTSQDSTDNRPDVIAADRAAEEGEGDGFNEFDAPLPGQSSGQSLGDVWRNNPLIKIALVGVGVVAVIAGLVMFGGSSDKNAESRVGSAMKEREAPGQETTEDYRNAINEVNQQRLEQAQQTGESTMPIPVAGEDTPAPLAVNEEPPVTLDDPLSGLRAGTTPQTAEPTLDPGDVQYQGQQQQPQQRVPVGPDPAAVDALAQAMGAQMSSILDKHKIGAPRVMAVTAADFYSKQATDAASSSTGALEVDEVKEILIPAGTIVYAQTLTEANTDAPGPVLARLSSGPLAGSRILGTFDDTDNYLTLQFNTIVVNGVSQSTNAVALDPKTTLPAVATEVDRRYWRRVILPAAARFIEGMGEAVAQREQTVVVTGDTAVSSQPDLNTRQELAAGLSEGTKELGQELDREADATKVMTKVHSGTPIGILFLEPVLKDPEQ